MKGTIPMRKMNLLPGNTPGTVPALPPYPPTNEVWSVEKCEYYHLVPVKVDHVEWFDRKIQELFKDILTKRRDPEEANRQFNALASDAEPVVTDHMIDTYMSDLNVAMRAVYGPNAPLIMRRVSHATTIPCKVLTEDGEEEVDIKSLGSMLGKMIIDHIHREMSGSEEDREYTMFHEFEPKSAICILVSRDALRPYDVTLAKVERVVKATSLDTIEQSAESFVEKVGQEYLNAMLCIQDGLFEVLSKEEAKMRFEEYCDDMSMHLFGMFAE